jgi:membrane protein implicated in regulation of membrane protease activity
MNTYNKIMLNFWLIAAVVIFVFTTYMCLTDNWKKWVFYYLFVLTSLSMYLFKKWMMRRMEKHMEYMSKKQEEK